MLKSWRRREAAWETWQRIEYALRHYFAPLLCQLFLPRFQFVYSISPHQTVMQSFTPQSPQPTPMNAPAETSNEFAPMPLRARGVLEQLDLAIKVYRRYLGVLLSWSALVLGLSTIIGLLGLVFAGQSLVQASQFSTFPGAANQGAALAMIESFSRLTSIFLLSGVFIFLGFPLIFGSVACAATAAVRGQQIEFEQCWAFIKPRYGGMILQVFLATLLAFVLALGVSFAFGIIIVLGGLLVAALARSVSILAVIIGVVGAIALYFGLIVLFMALYLWFMMIPIIASMEDNRRTSGAIGRSSALMRGGWWRAAGLMLLTGIAIWLAQTLVALILGVLISGLGAAAQMSVMFLLYMAMYTLIMPFYAVVAALFYLDQRVRHEALDLEWASYAGSESNPSVAPSSAMPIEYSNAPYTASTANNWTTPNSYAPPTQVPPTNDTPRNYANDNPFNASTEDLATMSLDDLMPKKKRAPNEIARAQAGTVAAFNLPQVPDAVGATPNSGLHQTQILPPHAVFSTDNADDATSSTRSDDAPVYAPQNEAFDLTPTSTPSQDATKTCAQCGAQATAARKFCLTCGARF